MIPIKNEFVTVVERPRMPKDMTKYVQGRHPRIAASVLECLCALLK